MRGVRTIEIRSVDGSITWTWDDNKQALITFLPNGDRMQYSAQDTFLMLKLLDQEKVRASIDKALNKLPRDVLEMIGEQHRWVPKR